MIEKFINKLFCLFSKHNFTTKKIYVKEYDQDDEYYILTISKKCIHCHYSESEIIALNKKEFEKEKQNEKLLYNSKD